MIVVLTTQQSKVHPTAFSLASQKLSLNSAAVSSSFNLNSKLANLKAALDKLN